jgi:hypothetical protein
MTRAFVSERYWNSMSRPDESMDWKVTVSSGDTANTGMRQEFWTPLMLAWNCARMRATAPSSTSADWITIIPRAARPDWK